MYLKTHKTHTRIELLIFALFNIWHIVGNKESLDSMHRWTTGQLVDTKEKIVTDDN